MHSKKAKREHRKAKKEQRQADEEKDLRRGLEELDARGEKLSFGKMPVRTRKSLPKKLDDATILRNRETIARWKEILGKAQHREPNCKDS